jgi:3'-5' exoribonuclease
MTTLRFPFEGEKRKNTFINQIRENDQVEGIFWVKEKAMITSRAGASYLRLRLSDRTGEIEGRVWDGVDEVSSLFERGDFIKIKAQATSYQERLQINIKYLKRCAEEEVSLEDFLPSTDRDPGEMLAELIEIGQGIENRYLKELIMAFLRDEEFTALFKRAPGATRLHHVYLGGLLEHTLSLVKLIQRIRGHYKGINEELLLTGGILHDVGKVRELSYDITFDYTDEGRLLGHILLGVQMVERVISRIEGFPSELAMLIKHLILSHHGEYEWGSPKRPMTLEAEILHHLDDLDAKFNGIQEFMKKGEEGVKWTDYHRMFERFFYVGNEEER